ncbi:MAG: peptidyl-prolyl cis-trans isomerase [Gammaproteobacteria bacterium]|nr:peptidyl-prolyl cis-trans isomerase [Gammaproteobacteria bacterium]
MITLHTNYGDIDIELDFDRAPKTAANFLQYCRENFYAGTIFHRVIPGFMVQGGGMDANMREKRGNPPIANEADNGLKNDIGTLAMARTNDPHSASSQFFINVADNGFLNHTAKDARGWGYAVFGKVVNGMAVVDEIKAVPTGNAGHHQDVPTVTVEIERVTVSDAYSDR